MQSTIARFGTVAPPYPIKWEMAGVEAFKKFMPTLFQLEGGYCNDLHDLGGETCWGITLNELKAYYGSDGETCPDIRELTQDQATNIYWLNYYAGPHLYWLPKDLAIAVFDWQVNGGRGVSDLQRVLGVQADGILGHVTINEVAYWLSRGSGEVRLLYAYQHYRRMVYYSYAHGDQSGFLDGWLNRCTTLEKYLGMNAQV